ncbi:hypothetical protein RD792_018109 [Penstemon davidsonii]|uniref:Beta-glucosidase n=1 Tax=Penstemon davidsonii TaxID=160366 RepID=A0ABR0DWE0_9LAMI|nr:hypothetical protein RD792_018109 [Penstemon davidsonii]
MDPQYRAVRNKLIGPNSTEIIGAIRRDSFDKDLLFGSATAAFQVEGAAKEGGRGPSIWDHWTLNQPDKVLDGSNGDVSVDQYHKYKEDVASMKTIGLEAYRFSISWPRVLPGGRINAGINREGIQYYSDLIDELLANGIEPYATLFHWDLPNALELEYGGFLSDKIVKDFTEFAELCFWEFGDRVKNWITFNEGWTYCNYGYVAGTFPPGRGLSDEEQRNSRYQICGHKGGGTQQICANGDAGTEPYLAAHNMILAHANAVNSYRKQFQENQGGKIGITNNCHFFEPLNDTDEDRDACIRALDWMLGWFVAPVTTGDYPPNMRKSVKERLPTFSPEETRLVKGSYDFLGLNYYTTWYATNTPRIPGEKPTYLSDQELTTQTERDGVSIGDPTGATWLFIVPRGLYNLLVYVKETYKADLIYITENGMADVNDTSLTISKARVDPLRARYYKEHLWYLRKAIVLFVLLCSEGGVNVKAYFLWAFADNFEWAEGYTSRFGIFYVDYKDGRYTRVPKTSAIWWKNFFTKRIKQGSLKREAKEIDRDYDLRKKSRTNNA